MLGGEVVMWGVTLKEKFHEQGIVKYSVSVFGVTAPKYASG